LRAWTGRGRRLTEAQGKVLDSIILANSAQIDDFEEQREKLEIDEATVAERSESRSLIEVLGNVREWHPPVTRGKRVFDDHKFCLSLSQHFAEKGFLSVKQKGALKRLIRRYRDQIPDYDRIAEQHGIGKGKSPRAAGGREAQVEKNA